MRRKAVVGCVFNGSLEKGQPSPTAKTSLCELEVVQTIETRAFLMKKSSMLQNVTMGMLDILCVLSTIACTRA
jgi:hypothetical protein